jgi:thiosulfate/3-mercaptopyruvate sulfurtransferase
LIEAGEVNDVQAGSKRVILDTREKEKYLQGHIPKAVWVDAAAWGKAVSTDQEPDNWTQRFDELGINADSEIVVYDDQRLRGAARVWWILRLWGIDHARVLNGGWAAYVESAGPTEKDSAPALRTGTVVAKRNANVLATKDLLLTAHRSGQLGKAGTGNLQLIDTRSAAEFCGTDTTRAKRTGTIPGSKNLEWSELLVGDSSRLKSPDELQNLLASKNIDVKQPAVSFCQGGGRAAVMAFTLVLLGSPESRNYYASWGEWGNADDTPIEKPAS